MRWEWSCIIYERNKKFIQNFVWENTFGWTKRKWESNIRLLKMIVRDLSTCHAQYTSDSSICVILFNRTTLQLFVKYLTGGLYVHPLWFYKHQQDIRVRSTQNALSLPFAAILVNCAPSGEMHNYCTPHIIKENSENFLIHRCNYILLSQVYCAWQVVKTPAIILNNPVQCMQVDWCMSVTKLQ
jgi:hypothetical protein